MAIDSAHDYISASGSSTAVVEEQRARQFRSARRNTMLVKSLRLVLPISCVVVVGLYAMSAFRAADWAAALPTLPIPTITPENLTMHNPRYDGYTKDGGSYVVAAKDARQDFDNPGVVILNEITGEFVDAKRVKTLLRATGGTYHTEAGVLDLAGRIDIDGEDGTKGRLTQAKVQTKAGIIDSQQPVDFSMRSGRITANTMQIRQKERAADFRGDVRATLQPQPDKPGAAAKPKASAGDAALLGDQTAPININARELAVRDLENRAVFTGLVQASQNDSILATEVLEIEYEPQESNSGATGAAASSGAGPESAAGAGKVRRIHAPNAIAMRRGGTQQITADSADFLAIEEKAQLKGNVVITSGETRRARADRADLDTKANTALLRRNVVVSQDGNVLRGDRLFIDRARNRTEMTSPSADGGNGRITARLMPNRTAKSSGKPTPKDVASAAAQKSGLGTFTTDPNAPVDIEASKLTVDDPSKTATFNGNVKAVQGGFTINTSQLVAHYKGNAALGDAVAADNSTSRTKSDAPQLTYIEAKGKVVVRSKDGQKASGDWAKFDIVKNTVVVGGDVVLSQGQNVVRGTRLEIDMTSGRSLIATSKNAAAKGWDSTLSDTAGNSRGTSAPRGIGARGGRPSAIFYPKQIQDGLKKSKSGNNAKSSSGSSGNGGTRQPKSSSSWDAITAPN